MYSVSDENKLMELNSSVRIITYNSMVCGRIGSFIGKFLDALIDLEHQGQEINKRYYERVDNLINLISNNLNITNSELYSKVMASIGLFEILLNQGIENKDIECLTEGFYGLEDDLKTLNIFKN